MHAADATEGRFPEPVGYVGVHQAGPELSVPFGGSIPQRDVAKIADTDVACRNERNVTV
jgi:hypothetical protein